MRWSFHNCCSLGVDSFITYLIISLFLFAEVSTLTYVLEI